MTIIEPQPIPQWLYNEVEEYFIPLPFEPKTILDLGANIGRLRNAHTADGRKPGSFAANRCRSMFLSFGGMFLLA